MKTKKFKNYTYIIILFISLFSCENDELFLKEIPNTFYTLENVFNNPSQVDASLTSCYQHVRKMYLNNGANGLVLLGKGTDVMDVAEFRLSLSFSDYTLLDPNRSEYNKIYSDFYQLISKANTVLYAANSEQINWQSEDEKKYIIAQAKFFRAFAYRSLGQLYGGVPIVEEIILEPKLDFKRATRIETYQFAINDMEEALNDLPITTPQGGRIVKGAAQHYLCELYLSLGIEMEEQGQNPNELYDKAINYANDVINGGTYNLMIERFGTRKNEGNTLIPGEPKGDVYWDLFQEGNVNYQDGNSECIWAFQIDFNAYLAGDQDSKLQWPREFGPVFRSLEGCIGTDPDVGGRGIASVMPTKYARDFIWEGQIGEGDMRNAEHNIRRTFYFNDPSYPKYGEVIPKSHFEATEWNNTIAFPIFMKLSTDKYTGIDQGETYSNLFRDEYIIRLPETILLRAELFLKKGQLQNAANDVNLIRDRAQCNYRATPQDITLNFILDERARELYGEEHRWNTLLRMGGTIAVDRIRQYAYWPFTKQSLTWNFNLWPIPQPVIDRNIEAKLEQNPGWTQF